MRAPQHTSPSLTGGASRDLAVAGDTAGRSRRIRHGVVSWAEAQVARCIDSAEHGGAVKGICDPWRGRLVGQCQGEHSPPVEISTGRRGVLSGFI